MQYEVENKFPVVDLSRIVEQLQELGAEFHDVIEQADLYFSHPARDFGETDEAFRIRCVGAANLVTYKGPKIDSATKTRREIELPLATGTERVEDYTELFEALGFGVVAEVKKRRRGGHLQWNQWRVELALDDVAELGHYVELEIVVDQERLSAAQSAILDLAAYLGLPQPERCSYLGMLLAKRSS